MVLRTLSPSNSTHYLLSSLYMLTAFTSTPASIYLFEVNNGNNKTTGEICSKLTIKTPEQRRKIFLRVLIRG